MLCVSCSKLAILHTKRVCVKCQGFILTNLSVICDKCSEQEKVCSICLKKMFPINTNGLQKGCRSCGK